MTRERRATLFICGLAVLLPAVIVFAVITGPVPVSIADIGNTVLSWIGLGSQPMDSRASMIIEVIRMPRVLLGVVVGSALAACGASMQGLFRNPLADPSIIGVSSGAALGAGIAIVLGGFLPSALTGILQTSSVSFMAFMDGFGATLLVYRIGTTSNGTSVATMLLAGIAISALSGAGLGIMNYVADDAMLRNLTFWQMGSLGGATWEKLILAAPILIILQLLLIALANGLNALLLGESEARHIGQNVQVLKGQLIMLTALGVGVSVSVSGMIGFVGLVVPHLVRIAIGPDHRYLLPAASLLGAILLVLADTVARVVITPAELPIGIVTALMGAPFFISLLWQQRNRIG